MADMHADTELEVRGPVVRQGVVPERLGPYRIVRCVGSGGMGVVYEALDEERGARVALKTLPAAEPGTLFRFKKEYRSLVDLTHFNLATLYELMAIDDTWFFTMELVDGQHFLEYVWGGSSIPAGPGLPLEAEARLRAALRQLTVGVEFLHAASLLHLDLKPANALVEPSGRVVILDFGLVQSLERGGTDDDAGVIAGTPVYVSPEQVLGARPTAASDWYAVGTILFEALTGTTPFDGTALAVTMARTTGPAPDPASRRDDLPPDLVQLCNQLLERDPARRAGGNDILEVCGDSPYSVRSKATRISQERAMSEWPLIGRENELETLRGWCNAGPASCLFVKGASGVGKTALVRELLARIENEVPQSIVLRGRCYERESVPYKGFDALVDALCRKLSGMPYGEQRALFDEDIHHTARIFSVLEDLEVLASIPTPANMHLEPLALRQRAFAGLKRLFVRLCARRKVVLFVDDLHWADADSAHLLCELLGAPDAPALVMLAAHREDEEDYSPFLRDIRARRRAGTLPFHERTMEVRPLPHEDAIRFARTCIGTDGNVERAADVAREAAGIPFFIDLLARDGGLGVEMAAPSLDRVLEARLQRMSEDARRMLQVVAIAARPIEQALAFTAARISGDSQAILAQLRSARMLRTRGSRGSDIVEVYHDRIRQNVAASMPKPELTAIHERLATTLEAARRAPADVLAYHLREAGQLRRAAEYAERAAHQAATALAFERAAELYANAWSWGDFMTDHARELQVRRAQALFNAGRCGEAATTYQAAADGAPPPERRELRGLAAEAFLFGGHVDEGMAVARGLLHESKLPYPSTPSRAMLSLVSQLGYLRLRGIEFARRGESDLSQEELFSVDLCWSLGKGLGNVLPLEGTYFLVRSLVSALQLGEPRRVGRGLALVGGTVLAPWAIGATYIQRAEALGRETKDPYLEGFPQIMRALGHVSQTARWKVALELVDQGVATLREKSSGTSWEAALGMGIAFKSLEAMGDLEEITRRSTKDYREAEERGDLFAEIIAGQCHAYSLIARGDIETARKQEQRLMQRWARGGYTAQHWYALFLRVYCDLYEGQLGSAWEHFQRDLPQIERAHLLKMPIARSPTLYLWALLQVARARTRRSKREREELLKAAEGLAQRLSREQRLDGPIHGKVIEAAVAAARGHLTEARSLLEQCRDEYRSIDMRLMSACAERRLGELFGNEERRRSADAEIRRHGIAQPENWTDAMLPPFI
ncbi:AAA family ATPase [Pendulispora brunnea]|uniref:AAA family ATPase n=1 Tax=Pendulispora brunnea TaxID=2905690 RepID=A0ABZ2KCL7_9BACT